MIRECADAVLDASPSRARLCSRENAHRVASRAFETSRRAVKVVRTGEPLQPFRVAPLEDVVSGDVELEIRCI